MAWDNSAAETGLPCPARPKEPARDLTVTWGGAQATIDQVVHIAGIRRPVVLICLHFPYAPLWSKDCPHRTQYMPAPAKVCREKLVQGSGIQSPNTREIRTALRDLSWLQLLTYLIFSHFKKCIPMWTSGIHWIIIFGVIGMWYYDIADKLEPGRSYSRTDVIAILKQERGGYRDNSYAWTVGALVKDGILQHDGRNQYSLPSKRKKPYVPLYSVAAQTIQFQVANRFPLTGFTVFEGMLLNEFLNHLIARNTIFVQVNRPLGAFVFDFIREYTEKPVLYRPSLKDFNNIGSQIPSLCSIGPVRHLSIQVRPMISPVKKC